MDDSVRSCSKCAYDKLLSDDGWAECGITQNINSGWVNSSLNRMPYLRRYRDRCHGCFKVGRRRYKLMLQLLYKLGVRVVYD